MLAFACARQEWKIPVCTGVLKGNLRIRGFSEQYPQEKNHAITCSHGFEVTIVLCLFAAVIGAFQEGETGMRCGAIAPMPQLPPQL
jgi:hypothetical protein